MINNEINENKIQKWFELVKEINPETKLFLRTRYLNTIPEIQPEWENLYWSINWHSKWIRKKENLVYIYCFWVDIDNKKNWISNEIIYQKLIDLEKDYWLTPNLINETSWWFHIIFNIEKTSYKLYKNQIPLIYDFLNDKLWGDKNFKWITGILKLPWSIDCKSWDEIIVRKKDFSFRNKIDLYIEIINKEYSRKFKVKDNISAIKEQDKKDANKLHLKDEFYEKVEKLWALTRFNKNSTDEIIRNQEWIIDNLIKDWCEISLDEELYINDNRIQVNSDTNTITDWVRFQQNKNNEIVTNNRWWIVYFLLRYIFVKDINPYVSMLKFINKYYGYTKYSSQNYITTNNFIYDNFINWEYVVDFDKIRADYWELNMNLVNKIKEEILDKNWKLKWYGLFMLLNLLDKKKENTYGFSKVTLNQILKDSYFSKENTKVLKNKLIEILEFMSYLKTSIKSYQFNNINNEDLWFNKKYEIIRDINLISFLKIKKDWNKTYLDITLFDALIWINNKLLWIQSIINKEILNIKYKKLGLYLFFDNITKKKYLVKDGIDITFPYLSIIANRKKDWDSMVYRHRKVKDLLEIYEKYFKNKLSLTVWKNHININGK